MLFVAATLQVSPPSVERLISTLVPAAIQTTITSAPLPNTCGSVAAFPLWPKPGREAKLVLVRAVKGGKAPFRVLGGLLLHEPDGRFTAETDAILRDGAELAFG